MGENNQEVSTVNFGKLNSTSKSFSSQDQATQWLEKERRQWAWLQEARRTPSRIQHEASDIAEHFEDVHNRIATAIIAGNYNQISDIFSDKPTPVSDSPIGGKILRIKKENGHEALGMIAASIGGRLPVRPSARYIVGISKAERFVSGVEGNEAEKEALVGIRSEFEKIVSDAKITTVTFNSDIAETKTAANTQIQEQKEAFDELFNSVKSENEDISKFYKEELALKAPVTYWKNRKRIHCLLAWVYAILTTAAFVTSGKYLTKLINFLFIDTTTQTTESSKLPPISEYWKLALLFISISAAIWIVRIFVRLMLSQVHLNTDAGERVVMANTYLSLLKEERAIEDQDRQLILNMLFRPASTGIVKEDSAPMTPSEALARLLSR